MLQYYCMLQCYQTRSSPRFHLIAFRDVPRFLQTSQHKPPNHNLQNSRNSRRNNPYTIHLFGAQIHNLEGSNNCQNELRKGSMDQDVSGRSLGEPTIFRPPRFP